MTTGVALLRGVNVGGNRRLPMAELRAAMTAAGFGRVRSYIASGNLLFDALADHAAAEAGLEALIARDFGFACKAIVRSGGELAALVAANPMAAAAAARPRLLHVVLTKMPPRPDAAAALAARATAGERIAAAGGALWIDYPGGVAASKLTPAMIDKAAGSTATGRNWNTLVTLAGMAAE